MKAQLVFAALVLALGVTSAKESKGCGFTGKLHNPNPVCPEGWVKQPGWQRNCYFLNKTPLNFEDAKDYCKSLGATMVSISREEQQAFVSSYLILDQNVRDNVWLGARQLGSRGTKFAWINGAVNRYTNWYPGEPNNHGEQCMEMVSAYGWGREEPGKWNDVPCDRLKPVLCQKTLEHHDPTFEIQANCPGKDFLVY